MDLRLGTGWLVAVLTGFAGIACVRYEPSPVDPSAHSAVYRARRLDHPALSGWVARYAGRPAPGRWTDRQLALAALAFRADVARARRAWLAARAGVTSAGARPAPGAEAGVERAASGTEDSPWVVSLAGLFTLELGGKRGARVQAARAREAIAESDLLLSAQAARNAVRAGAVAVVQAEQTRDEAAAVLDRLQTVAHLERGRFREAALGSAELARTGAELALARVQVAEAEREVVATRAALAGEVAVPAPVIRDLDIAVLPAAGCAWADSLGSDSVLALAATQRGQVARALGEYAAAEAQVRFEVARQRPDLELGPGVIWDQGVHRWTLAFALPTLLGFRNRARIEEAQAARAAAAARVDQAQDAVLAEAGEAVEGCRGAAAEGAVADSLRVAAEGLVEVARAGYERGEIGRLEQARAELALVRAASARRAAERRLARSGLAVEAALGEWREAAARPWPDPRGPGFDEDAIE